MPYYLVISGEENWAYSVELSEGQTYRLGRAQDNDIVLKDRRTSSYHARIASDDGKYVVTDLESRNGTFVNEARVRKATLNEGDRVRMGQTTLQFVEKLDPKALSGSAILSPRLSQPLLRTEMTKLRDLIGELTTVQDRLARGLVKEQDLPAMAEQMGRALERLHDVENHMRTLISTNHFHELFHRPRPARELFAESLRFVASALEAENGAIVLLEGSALEGAEIPLSVQATVGLSVAGWPGGIPQRSEVLLREALRDRKTVFIRQLGSDPRFRDWGGVDLSTDRRSILVVPLLTNRGRILGAAYFDNPTRPERLNQTVARMAEGCFAILADHVTGESEPERPALKRDETADFNVGDEESKTLLSLE